MAERWFLKIDGIEGESTHPDHKAEIDVVSWSWGVNQSATSSGSGGGAGKASFQDFHFVSRISKASPALFLATASGSRIKSARLTGLRGAGKIENAEFMIFKFHDLLISSYVTGDNENDEPVQIVSFNYGKLEHTFVPTSSTGASQPPVTAGWDLKLNKKI